MEIDAVIAWVDGDDPAHIAKRAAVSDRATHVEADRPTRWASNHEVYWCIASILLHAPYIRTIWIVTDDQRPPLLDRFVEAGLVAPGRIRVVDHTTIFEGLPAALPTFNSLTIEAALHRIPGLAERFVYMNDDFFLCRPIPETEWFDADGHPVIAGEEDLMDRLRPKVILRKYLRRITFRPPNARPSYRVAHNLGAELAGRRRTFILQEHVPHPMRRSILQAFDAERPDVIGAQVAYRYRDRRQYLPVSLANHLEIERYGVQAVPAAGVAYFKPKDRRFGGRERLDDFKQTVASGAVPYGCLQSLDEAPDEMREELIAFMSDTFSETLPPDMSSAT